jgi:dihydrofolate reductase
MHTIILVAVLGKETRAIGLHNKLLWRIPPDMARFVEITTGHPVIMGRKTWESIEQTLSSRVIVCTLLEALSPQHL